MVDGTEVAAFSELQGMTTEIEVTEFIQTSDAGIVHKKLPGKAKPPTVTLRGTYDDNSDLWSWHEAARLQNLVAARRNCSLVMYGSDGTPVARYVLSKAYPSKIEIGGLKARGRRRRWSRR